MKFREACCNSGGFVLSDANRHWVIFFFLKSDNIFASALRSQIEILTKNSENFFFFQKIKNIDSCAIASYSRSNTLK